MGANMAGASFNLWHTKEELEEAGFGWVFFCDGVSVEEVKQWYQSLRCGLKSIIASLIV